MVESLLEKKMENTSKKQRIQKQNQKHKYMSSRSLLLKHLFASLSSITH